jgi:hypothetical protein
MNNIAERLDYARKQAGLTYIKLGSYVNIGGDAVRASIRRNSIKDYYLNVFSEKLSIRKDWLLTGEGNMLRTTPEASINGMKEIIDFLDAQSKMGGSESNKATVEENKHQELSSARRQVIILQKEEIERLKEEIKILKKELKNP